MTATHLQEIERQLLDIEAMKKECLNGVDRLMKQLARLEQAEIPLRILKAQLMEEN